VKKEASNVPCGIDFAGFFRSPDMFAPAVKQLLLFREVFPQKHSLAIHLFVCLFDSFLFSKILLTHNASDTIEQNAKNDQN
jgi:hypothetical protein